MLGYDEFDLSKMIMSIQDVSKDLDAPAHIKDGLNKAEDFLQGLWAEGYFD
jgi:hypothetical protein